MGFSLLSSCGLPQREDLVAKGYALLESGDVIGAADVFQGVVHTDKGNLEMAWRGLGIALLYTGNYDGAYQALIESLQHASGVVGDLEFDTSYYLAYCADKMGLYKEAHATYDSILNLRSKEKQALLGRGLTSLKLSDINGAKTDFDEYLRLNKSSVASCLDIYYAFKEVGLADEAAAYLQKAYDDSDKISDLDQGKIALYSGDYITAQNFLAKAAQTEFSREVALLHGQSYTLTQDYTSAAAIYDEYLNKLGDDPYILNEYGVCLMQDGNYQAAYDCFIRANDSLGTLFLNEDHASSDLSDMPLPENFSQAGVSEILDEIGNISFSDEASLARPIDAAIAFNEIIALEYLHRFGEAKEKMAKYVIDFPNDDVAQRENIFLETR